MDHLINFFSDTLPRDSQQLVEILKQGVNLNLPLSSDDGRRALHVAATEGDVIIVQILLDHGAYIDVPDYYGNIPSHYAARGGHLEVLRLLIDKGANVNIQNDKQHTVLKEAVCSDQPEILRLLVSTGVCWELNSKCIMVEAVENGCVGVVKELMVCFEGNPCSYQCSMYTSFPKTSNRKIIEMIVKSAAKSDIKLPLRGFLLVTLQNKDYELIELFDPEDEEWKEALCTVLENGDVDAVNFILDVRPDLLKSTNLENHYVDKDSVLHNAIVFGNIEIIDTILENVKHVNIESFDGKSPLIVAIEKALRPVAKSLLEKGADIEMCDQTGNTALFYAVLCEEPIPMIELLMEWGFSVNDECTNSKKTPLHVAAGLNNIDLIQFLLQKQADVNARDSGGNIPFFTLFLELVPKNPKNVVSCAKMLLEEGTTIDIEDDYQLSKIMMDKVNRFPTEVVEIFLESLFSTNKDIAVRIITSESLRDMIFKGHISLLKGVLSKVVSSVENPTQVNIDSSLKQADEELTGSTNEMRSSDNTTRLLYAAYVGDVLMAQDALQSGADMNVVSEEGLTALQLALYRSSLQVAMYLVDMGADLNVIDQYTLLPIQLAVILGDAALVQKCYAKTCQRMLDCLDLPLLNLAAYRGNIEMVSFILKRMPDVNSRDVNGNTVLHTAVRKHDKELVDFVMEKKVDVNAQNGTGDTAFHVALKTMEESKSSGFEIATTLLNHGIDIDIRNNEGKTVLHLATANNLTPLITLLLDKGVKNINEEDNQGRTPFYQLMVNLKEGKSESYNATSLVILFLKNGATEYQNLQKVLENLTNSDFINFDRIVLEIFSDRNIKMNNLLHSIAEQAVCGKKFHLVQTLLDRGFRLNLSTNLLDLLFEHDCNVKANKIYIDDSCLFKSIEQADLETVKVLLDRFLIEPPYDDFYFPAINIAFSSNPPKYGQAQVFLDRCAKVQNIDYFPPACVPLTVAAQNNNNSMVNILLDKGADVNEINDDNESALDIAIRNENPFMVALLLARGACWDTWVDCLGMTHSYLHLAARTDSEITKLLLAKGANPNVAGVLGSQTPLHFAAYFGNHEVVELLLNAGAKLSFKDQYGNTPMHKATSFEVVKVLVKKGASVTVKNRSGKTPLHVINEAFKVSNVNGITNLLVKKGAKVNSLDKHKRTPLHIAAGNSDVSDVESLSALIRNGAKLDVKDDSGRTPLHHAVTSGWHGKVEFLLDHGASLEVKDNSGRTPLLIASENDSSYVLLVLLRKGADVDAKDNCGNTALHNAVKLDKLRIITPLLFFGPSLSEKNLDGFTPYQLSTDEFFKPWFNIHICMLRLAGIRIDEEEDSYMYELNEEFIEGVLRELDRMNQENEGIRLIDIFSKCERPSYLFDENFMRRLKALFQSSDFNREFPNYADIMRGTVCRAKRSRYYLKRRAVISLMRSRKEWCRDTPDLVWEHLTKFLSNQDLKNVIQSGKY